MDTESAMNAVCSDTNSEKETSDEDNRFSKTRPLELNDQCSTSSVSSEKCDKPRIRPRLPPLRKKSSSAFREQRLPNLVRTLQIASSWKRKSKLHSSPTPRVDSFLERFEMGGQWEQNQGREDLEVPVLTHRIIHPSKTALYRWLILVTLAVLYNFIFIIARSSFYKLHQELSALWFLLDYLCDIIYIADMFVQFRTGECYFIFIK